MKSQTRKKIIYLLVSVLLLFNISEKVYAKDKLPLRSKIKSVNKSVQNDDLQTLLKLLRVYIKTERLQEATDIANQIIMLDDGNIELYTLLSELYIKTSNFYLAEKSARRILEIEPNNVDGYLLLGSVFLERSRYAGTIEQRKELLRKAYKCFKKVYYDYPEDPRPYVGLGRVHFERDEFDKSLSFLMIARELDRTDSTTLYYIGDFHKERKNYEKAIKYLNMSVKFSDYPCYKTHFILGNIYEKLADIEKARNEYKAALKVKPGDEKSLERYRRIEDL